MIAGALALGLLFGRGCGPAVRVATFNIRQFPEKTTKLGRVADTLAELDADVIGVQEIVDPHALAQVLDAASRTTGRRYQAVLSTCRRAQTGDTTGLVWDASRLSLVEAREFPELEPRDPSECGRTLPGLLGVFAAEDGHRVAVLSVHFEPFPQRFDVRREQWRRVIEIQRRESARLGTTVLAVGDYNSTGFSGDPARERRFVRDTVNAAGFRLLTAALPCSEYYRKHGSGAFLPSILDHVVATDDAFGAARVTGYCERLACAVTKPERMDPDFDDVSDHCPVVVEGRLRR